MFVRTKFSVKYNPFGTVSRIPLLLPGTNHRLNHLNSTTLDQDKGKNTVTISDRYYFVDESAGNALTQNLVSLNAVNVLPCADVTSSIKDCYASYFSISI